MALARFTAEGVPEPELLAAYPQLQSEDIRAALAFAAEMTRCSLSIASRPPKLPFHHSARLGSKLLGKDARFCRFSLTANFGEGAERAFETGRVLPSAVYNDKLRVNNLR
jgi:hypothetical protein